MARRIFSKVLWLGRATSAVVGLAVILALILGVATAALGAAPATTFKLGQINTSNAVSTLVGAVSGSNLKIENTGTDANSTALELKVPQGKAPLTVKAADSQKLEGKQASEFAAASHTHSGEDITSGTVNEARIDGAIARDGEIMPTVKANDGSGSGVDSDTLDGRDSSTYLPGGNLPSGATVRGIFVVSEHPTDANQTFFAVASFGYRVQGVSAVHYIRAGEPTPTGCSGSVSNPGAAPGNVCFFEQEANLAHPGGAFLWGGSGAAYSLHSTGAGFMYADGSWAATAP